METPSARIVIAYDGSASAATAVRAAAGLFGTARAYIATVPEHAAVSLGTAMPIVPGVSPAMLQSTIEELEAGARRDVDETARAAGLDAVGETVESDDRAWRAIVAAARAHGASVIAAGTRGLGAARSALLGSVSSGLIQNAELPIIVVPDAPAAAMAERAG